MFKHKIAGVKNLRFSDILQVYSRFVERIGRDGRTHDIATPADPAPVSQGQIKLAPAAI
jgi:hypothetical protein